MKGKVEVGYIEYLRDSVERQYSDMPTGGGGSFGEILCFEIHENNMTFEWLAKKWGVSLTVLGELIWDHCKRLEPLLHVNHRFKP